MTGARCIVCGDPGPNDWLYCRKCHAWNDLGIALTRCELGLDEFRLRRARRYFARGQSRESVRALLAKLLRRIEDLEYDRL